MATLDHQYVRPVAPWAGVAMVPERSLQGG